MDMVLKSPGYGELFPIDAVGKYGIPLNDRTLPNILYAGKRKPFGKQQDGTEDEIDKDTPVRARCDIPFRTSNVKLILKPAGKSDVVVRTRVPLDGIQLCKERALACFPPILEGILLAKVPDNPVIDTTAC